VDYDLSDVMFVATANTLENSACVTRSYGNYSIPGYTEDEKYTLQFAIFPKQKEANGLKEKEIEVAEKPFAILCNIIRAKLGVRNLEREISKIFRKSCKRNYVNPKG